MVEGCGCDSLPRSHSGTRLTEVSLFAVTQWEAGGLSRGQIHERLKSLDLILRARGISAFNAFCSIH